METEEVLALVHSVDIALEHLQLIASMYTTAPLAAEVAKEALEQINAEMIHDET
jgi:hypothetical protein